MNKKLKRKQALIMAEPYRTPFNSKVAKVSGDVIEDSVGEINKPTRSYDFKVNGFSNVVKSSNLLNIPDTEENLGGIEFKIKNGIVTINGTSDSNQTLYVNLKSKISSGTYSFNSFASDETRCDMYLLGPQTQIYNSNNLNLRSTDGFNQISFFVVANTNYNNFFIKPMLVSDSTMPTHFIPYLTYIESFANKKNLLGFDDVEETTTIGGVTYSIKNGVFTLNGTSSKSHNIFINLKKPINSGTYSFNAFTSTGSRADIYLNAPLVPLASLGAPTNTKSNISLTSATQLSVWFPKDEKYDNRTFKPMLVESDKIPTTFLPYQDKYSAFLNVKGKNLLEFDDVENVTTKNGMTYSIKDGVITLNGTNSSTSTQWIWIDFISTLNGTYSFNSFASTTTYETGTRISLYDNTTEKTIAQLFNNEYSSTIELTNYECKKIGIACGAGQTFTNATIKPMLVSGSIIPTEYEPYYSFTKEVLIKQPLRKFDYLTYDGVYRQTNEIVLDGSWDVVDKDFLWEDGRFVLSKTNVFFPLINNWEQPFSQLYITTTSDLPLLPLIELQNQKKKGIAVNNGDMIIKLDDSADNSLNNWTVEKINNYFKQNPITITYKTVDQTFEATSLTRLLFKNGYNKITAYDSINNNAIVEYLEYYKSK